MRTRDELETVAPRDMTREELDLLRARYAVVRFYFRGGRRTLATGLTLAQAQAHCGDPETSSSTATKYVGRKRTERLGPWFDGYEKE